MDEKEIKGTTENVAPVESTPVSTAKPVENKKSSMLMMEIVVAVLIVVGIIAGVLFLMNKGGRASGKIDAKNPIDEVNQYVGAVLYNVTNNLDFTKVDPNNPSTILSANDLTKAMNESNSQLKYLKSTQIEKKGSNTQLVLKGSYQIANSSNSDMTVTFNATVYSEPSSSYDASLWNSANLTKSLSDLTTDKLAAQFGKSETNFLFTLTSKTGGATGNIDIFTDGLKAYVRLNSLDGSLTQTESFKSVALIKGKVISFDLTNLFKKIQQNPALLQGVSGAGGGTNAVTSMYIDQLNQSLAESFKSLTSDDITLLKDVQDPVKNILKETSTKLTLFKSVKKVDPIISKSDANCYSGAFDADGTFATLKKTSLDIGNVVIKDKSYKGTQTLDQYNTEVEKSFSDMLKKYNDAATSLNLRLCNDKSNNALTGFGLDLAMKNSVASAGNMTVNFDFQTAANSDHKVNVPKADVDYTNELNSILDSYLGSFGGLGGSTFPASPGAGGPSGGLITKPGAGAYTSQYEQLMKDCQSGKISQSACTKQLQDLYTKYYGDGVIKY